MDRRPIPIATIARALIGLSVVGLVVWFFASGAHRNVDEGLIRARIDALGVFGPVVFVVAFSMIQPLGPSGHIFAVAASLVWRPVVAIPLALLGAIGSQIVGFLFYRYVAADWARGKVPAWLAAYEERMVAKPIRYVFWMRVFTFTSPFTSMLLGISKVRFTPMVVGTVFGLAPTIAFDVLFLTSFLRWVSS